MLQREGTGHCQMSEEVREVGKQGLEAKGFCWLSFLEIRLTVFLKQG